MTITTIPLEPGMRFGKYEVLAYVATGGMGTVYKAIDSDLRRIVALKVLPAEVAECGPLLERLRREARHTARLGHPNIVTLFEYGYNTEFALHFLALEFVDGINLHDYIEHRRRLQPEDARRILLMVAKALDHAFGHGVVHRDIKPANILLAESEHNIVVKLTDFGLAQREQDDDFKVTREGSTVGTIDYMAPEQARDSALADIRSDIYALGCTAYHMLAGRAPFAEGGLGERVYKHQNIEPYDVRAFNPAVSAGFWRIVQKMLAKNPDDRYATPRELFAELKITPAESFDEAALAEAIDPDDRPTSVPSLAPTRVAMPVAPAQRPGKSEPNAATVPALAADTLITQEQTRAAAAMHQRAVQVLTEGRGDDYARKLLANCLKLDPFNPIYRKTLRAMRRAAPGNILVRWFRSLSTLAVKSKMRLAYSSGNWRKVLDLGEEILARQPADVATHLEMAAAAQNLAQPNLALWLLEEGRTQVPDDVALLRALAQFHEGRCDWKRSIAFWESVRKASPSDCEAPRKINDLSAQEVLTNGHYTAG